MERVMGVDVSKTQPDAYRLEDGRRLAVGNDAVGIAAKVDHSALTRRIGWSWRPRAVMSAGPGVT